MKKYYSLFLFWSLLTGLSTSCSDDNKKDPYLPTPPQVSIGNPSGQTTCLPGETIELKAILNNPLQTTFQWQLNKKTVSTDSIYRFTSQDPGSFEIILTATNQDGKDSDTLFLKVNGNRFAISDLKNWTGNGENTSVFAIQWVTGEHLQEPADQEVFFIAWGYRWNKTETFTGIDMLKAIAEYAKHDRAEFVRVVQEAQSSQQTAEVRKQRTRLATAKQRVSELEVLLCKIYEDNILGKLSDSRYATLDAQYEKEQSELTAEISVLEKAVKSYEKHEKDADRFIALIDKYENFDKLTIAMLNEFIEKILVHERDRKGSIQTTQEVEIYFNFVGRFVPPAFGEAELTPEELEEIRKREERKDRLHQNYLKRKASGAQKRYEDKIKKRKKAEIEAKKAAIRAEDIAKGVFVPVSSLPQREPMKGVQTA